MKFQYRTSSPGSRIVSIAFLAASAFWFQLPATAQVIEEVVVTGTYIRGASTDAPVPVSVIGRGDIEEMGAPTVTDLVNDLPWASGNENRSNALGAQNNNTGAAMINLRGLGLGSTLTLFNGKRMTSQATATSDGSKFVDINYMPSIMLDRIEILKDGAAALYGSDAVAGVVNLMPRSMFTGFETQLNFRNRASGADQKNWDISAIWGTATTNMNLVIAAAYSEVGKLREDQLDFTTPQMDANRGVSSLAGPGSFIPTPDVSDPAQLGAFMNLPNVIGAPFISGMPINDPNCEATGGIEFNVAGTTADLGLPDAYGRCGYTFVRHYNVADDQQKINVYSNLNYHLNDRHEFYADLGYYNNDVDEIGNSPSFPVLKFVTVPGSHPDNMYGMDGIFLGRPFGQNFPTSFGYREYETWRTVGGFRGDINLNWDYDVSLSYSTNNVDDRTPTVYQQRFDDAMNGLGGPNCDPASGTPGAGSCYYFNPFGTRFSSSPNREDVEDHLRGINAVDATSELFVLDAVFTGDLWEMKHGPVQSAFGFQYREDTLEVDRDEDSVVPGTWIFVGGGNEYDESQDVYAVFGELSMPLAMNVDMQLAARYEDYGSGIGNTFDPKIAVRWDFNHMVTLRASASTTFRAPTLNQRFSTGTALVSLVDGGSAGYKAVDATGDPSLEPESANSYNIGLLFNPTPDISASIDYWRLDFTDIIGTESAQARVNIENINCPGLTPDCRDPKIIRNPIGNEDPNDNLEHSGEITRVISQYINAPAVDTDGVDVDVTWNIPTRELGNFQLKLQGMYQFNYTISGILGVQDGQVGTFEVEAVGSRNEQNFARPLPEWKANLSVGWVMGNHAATAIVRHITDYEDDKTVDRTFNDVVDAQTTLDLHYTYSFADSPTSLSLGLLNATDEDPPFADQDLNFDARTHSPFGRMYRIVLRHAISQ
ncbi:MAG: TonB-dependent receptor [Gammaproteobacteria bacterium]|nr:TonB-dependent receptor [Gammaproteobacteria bacterium]